MARKKKHPEHVNHERWLISYADFITLLFAFFVVMFAVSQVDSKKVGRFTESFSKAVGLDTFQDPGAGLMPGGETPLRSSEIPEPKLVLDPELEELKGELVDLKQRTELPKELQVLQRKNELVVRLSESLFFDAGDDRLNDPSAKAMRILARELKARKVDIRVEGHTDNRPIRTARYRSNWDLSTSRSTAVVAMLADAGIEPERLSAAGYGEFHPISKNTDEEGRRKNRRVDIVIRVSTIAEPEAESAPEKVPEKTEKAPEKTEHAPKKTEHAPANDHGTEKE